MSQLSNNEKINDTTSDIPQLCRSCLEFFGTRCSDYLCSSCFKKQSKTEEAALNLATKVLPEQVKVEETKPVVIEEKVEEKIIEVVVEAEKPKPVEKESNKCSKCTKKVGVMGWKCKCGSTYCKNHRLPEDHDCGFDFKQDAVAKLTKQNPLVVASKLDKI
eukprot:GHVU01125814.1.p1 GENE.GHVU01125814.1~~GHVU01125814.1.p1  ORF type:complete len:161 (-),score=38.84 GHVU01125814.1:255-737(-)